MLIRHIKIEPWNLSQLQPVIVKPHWWQRLYPARYPHTADSVEHLQTHISHILLVGDAYKIKKPLDLGLDFTSLAHRKSIVKRSYD
ncbi:MAG: hypothetical protein R3F37_19185 [Candidatus Competibacteraceae bacterium]